MCCLVSYVFGVEFNRSKTSFSQINRAQHIVIVFAAAQQNLAQSFQHSKNPNAIPKPSISTCKNPRATLDYGYYWDSNCRVLTSVNQLRLGKESIKKIRFGGQEIRFATDKFD